MEYATVAEPGFVDASDPPIEEPAAPAGRDVEPVKEVEQRPRRKRLQIDLSDVAFQRLTDLVDESGAESVAEFSRRALQFYAFFLEHRRRGYRLMLAHDVKDFEVLEL
jgi:hypothetical protein